MAGRCVASKVRRALGAGRCRFNFDFGTAADRRRCGLRVGIRRPRAALGQQVSYFSSSNVSPQRENDRKDKKEKQRRSA